VAPEANALGSQDLTETPSRQTLVEADPAPSQPEHRQENEDTSEQSVSSFRDAFDAALKASDLPSTTDTSSSAYLFHQSSEEEEDKSSKLSAAQEQALRDQPWTGDEPINRAVLRMLIDKYPPLRVPGTVKKIQQPVQSATSSVEPAPEEEGKRTLYPWEHTFVHPKHMQGVPENTIKSGSIVKLTRTSRPGGAERIGNAREKIVDLRSGKTKRSHSGNEARIPMPGSIRAWNGLVEERIEVSDSNQERET
jgi:DnaJ homolog subfamily C member 28